MANNKVQLANGTVLIDITDTTANASDVLSGEYFYDASGVKTEGSLTIPSTYTVTKTLTHVTTNNDDTEVLAGGSFYMDLIPEAGYIYIDSITVTMGGVDITDQVFKAGVGQKMITQNGIYDAEDDYFSGYSSVNVNVPNSYTSFDEGKVVSNGTLVAQTSNTITQNGTVDTTLINSLTVNVSGGTPITYPYPIGHNWFDSNIYLTVDNGHVKIQARKALSNFVVGLRYLGTGTSVINNQNTWFTISSGNSVVFNYSNVVNSSNIVWNANLRKASATTSLSYGIGDETHLNGETLSVTASATNNVGAYFVYISSASSGNVLEFDVSLTVNNIRYF